MIEQITDSQNNQQSNKSQKSQKSKESSEESTSSGAEDVNKFSAEGGTGGNARASEVRPFGTTFYVYAEVHKELPEVQFIVDTGAGVSLLPQKAYDLIPQEDRPQLEQAERHVYCGNNQGIRIAGIAYMKIRLQSIEYQAAFHVTPDVHKGIL